MFRLNAASEGTYLHPIDIDDKKLQQPKYSSKILQQARIIFFFPSLKGMYLLLFVCLFVFIQKKIPKKELIQWHNKIIKKKKFFFSFN